MLPVFCRLARSSGGNGGLSAGPAVLFFCVETPGFNIDSFTIIAGASSRTPVTLTGAYEGGAQIPGKIEAEKFDYGGQGVAYSDTDVGNNGGVGWHYPTQPDFCLITLAILLNLGQ